MSHCLGPRTTKKAAERVVQGNPEWDLRVPFEATLLLEPNNPHDPGAIAVYGEGKIIGHFSREDAAKYRPALEQRASFGAPITAPGTIYAGHNGGSGWSIGVKIPTPKQIEKIAAG